LNIDAGRKRLILKTEEEFAFETLVVAAGARSRILQIPEGCNRRTFASRLVLTGWICELWPADEIISRARS
jgi:NAD(P)H-nitrite reductase large subunit